MINHHGAGDNLTTSYYAASMIPADYHDSEWCQEHTTGECEHPIHATREVAAGKRKMASYSAHIGQFNRI